jgi:hypothetical protein
MSIPGVPYHNPLSYTGPQMNLIPIKMFFREPTVTDTKYRVGSVAITGAASPGIDTITTDDGAPAVDPDGNGNVEILGGNGCSVTGQGPGNTVTIDVLSDGYDWEVIQDSTKTIEAHKGYFSDRGAGVAFTLPASAEVGDSFKIVNVNAGGFTIAQNAGQVLNIGNDSTTTGVGGSVASTDIGDCVTFTCAIANTTWWPPTLPKVI